MTRYDPGVLNSTPLSTTGSGTNESVDMDMNVFYAFLLAGGNPDQICESSVVFPEGVDVNQKGQKFSFLLPSSFSSCKLVT